VEAYIPGFEEFYRVDPCRWEPWGWDTRRSHASLSRGWPPLPVSLGAGEGYSGDYANALPDLPTRLQGWGMDGYSGCRWQAWNIIPSSVACGLAAKSKTIADMLAALFLCSLNSSRNLIPFLYCIIFLHFMPNGGLQRRRSLPTSQ
jgi:hypothetical protein